MNVSKVLAFAQSHKSGVAQVTIRRPLNELELSHEHRFWPQCRMPDYAASGVASVVITAFSVILFRHNQAGIRQRNRAGCSRQ
jgi:hypothetical protein